MMIDAKHISSVTQRNIHIVRWPNNLHHVEKQAREAAGALGYHLAVLACDRINTEHEVLLGLADSLLFPMSPVQRDALSWNVVIDFLRDLSWLTESRGALVFLRDPESLLKSNPIQFAMLMDALGRESIFALKRWFPFHVVVGPMPKEYIYECFMNVLGVSSQFCEACQLVDGDFD